ncbi:hypothetical protein C9I57_25410 [Trinickia symbiotica]|uniref:HEPN AbiU2-like domain-containing protein n=1 Tax=Trinickia symbiotica TaxID=863227 RepID=A0A2T3XN25_9BURK|nr:hypothetical protein [Trinickia symbiotica]PTB17867.1 hypothetical protein C9I57_25410 [Trinickia symbiotica]
MTKFIAGDATDLALCATLKHEYLRCSDAFEEFARVAETMIMQGEDRRLAFKTYNAYTRFIHHLYEFLLAATQRDRKDTAEIKHELADQYIHGIAQRSLNNRREAILNGTAPPWENHISAFPEKVPKEFASQFRKVRNTALGHANPQRHSLSLTDFYHQFHMFLYMIYVDSMWMWGRVDDDFPDLGQITAFSVMIKEKSPRN